MSAQQTMVAPGSDTSSDVARVVDAAHHLHDFREGIAAHLEWLAEDTADKDCPSAASVIAQVLAGLPDAYRRGVQITTIAGDLWGIFPLAAAPERREALRVLRAVCRDTASAVMAELYRDSCICREVTR